MKNIKAFTLIELIMVIVILGVLSAVVLPRFVDLQAQAKVSASKGALGSIRSAVSFAYGSNLVRGIEPPVPNEITESMFNDERIPTEPLTNSSSITFVSGASAIGDGAGWAYDSILGRVWVNNLAYTSY